MPHTWYLAADFGCFVYGLIFIMLSWRFSKFKTLVLVLGGVFVIFMPVVVILTKGYSAVYMASPEYVQYLCLLF